MKVIGGGETRIYTYDDELSHDPTSEPAWQESVFLFWHDPAHGISGIHRLGHEPNCDGGKVALWSHVTGPEGSYTHTSFDPLASVERRRDVLSAGQRATYRFDGKCHWDFDDIGLKGSLTLEDFHDAIDLFPPSSGAVADDVAKNHLEASGRVTGRIELAGKEYEIDGVQHRDHSWGIRKWHSMLTHRWTGGVLDGRNGFAALNFLSDDGHLHRSGYVIRDDVVCYANDVDIIVHVEPDGLSHRGATMRMTLVTGEVLDFTFEPLGDQLLCVHHENSFLESICRVRCGDSEGVADFEITNNSHRGFNRPVLLPRVISANGVRYEHA